MNNAVHKWKVHSTLEPLFTVVALQKLWRQSQSEIAVKRAQKIDNVLPLSQSISSFLFIIINERHTKEG